MGLFGSAVGLSSSIVQGGWSALSNIVSAVGKGAGAAFTTVFPAAQRTTIQSEIMQPRGGTGLTYRPTAPSAPSLAETAKWASQSWLGTPYELQFTPGNLLPKNQAAAVSTPAGGTLVDIITGAGKGIIETSKGILAGVKEVRTVVDDFMELWGIKLREPITTGPAPATTVQHPSDTQSMAASIYNLGKAIGSEFVNQVKGLFNIGFPQTEKQAGFAITHEVDLTGTTKTTIYIAIAVIAALILLKKRQK